MHLAMHTQMHTQVGRICKVATWFAFQAKPHSLCLQASLRSLANSSASAIGLSGLIESVRPKIFRFALGQDADKPTPVYLIQLRRYMYYPQKYFS